MKMQKFEDIDTNPNNPRQVVLAESTTGVYIIDFDLIFDNDGLNKKESKFAIEMISDFESTTYAHPDNVDWTKNNLIFVNKDNEEGGIWYMNPNGSGKTQVGKTAIAGESTGILDLSHLLDYPPSSVIVTTNQGSPSSMTLLLNPDLEGLLVPNMEGGEDTDEDQCPKTQSPENQVLEAEDATIFDARVRTKEINYCEDGYVDFEDDSGMAGILFSTRIETEGSYKVSIRYSNGSPSDRPAFILVDDRLHDDEFDFSSTSDWSSWSVETKKIVLDEGEHILELWWGQEKRPNIDWLSITLTDG
jgi:hypothetical protein